MLWLLAHNPLPLLGEGGVAREVWRLYHHWYGVLTQGTFPAHDPLWQYPSGAAPVLLSPEPLPGLTYFQAFVALTLVAATRVRATTSAVISLLTLTRSPRACGAFAALGALMKGWLALVLLGTPQGRPARSAWSTAALTGLARLALLTTAFDHPFAFPRQQGDRGRLHDRARRTTRP